MKKSSALLLLLFALSSYAQELPGALQKRRMEAKDSIRIDSVPLNTSLFFVQNKKGDTLAPNRYQIDYNKALLFLEEQIVNRTDSIDITYQRYPSFLTQKYFTLDPKIIVQSTENTDRLYSLRQATTTNTFTPFDGLTTVGSISRGVTVGNNQNAVVNSQLDLQITGQLNEKVGIRASIQDANIPSQQGGFSQNLDEFDQIFIELFSDNWNIRAGDVDLIEDQTYFSRFTKKVQGISLKGQVQHQDGSTTQAFASGALVRGVFSRSTIIGQEGNQGPYKLVGPNGELFILIISGSERVFVNGVLLQRGENEDYIIDYNAGEIRFNPTYPINSAMRINVEYQFTDRNYTRFIGFGGGQYTSDSFRIGAQVYTENDAKNQPLQQNLNEEQVGVLQQAGDNRDLMVALSAVEDTFAENKILYRKEINNGVEIFVFSENPDDVLFNVRFSLVGQGNGNYILTNTNAINRIYVYVPPLNGIPQGDYEPVIQLIAPTKLQLASVYSSFTPSEKTQINSELTASDNDINLFSNIDDANNVGIAGHIDLSQRLWTLKDSTFVNALASVDYISDDFRNVERTYNIEFNRDWNLENLEGSQLYSTAGVSINKASKGNAKYLFEQLQFDNSFTGYRHLFDGVFTTKKWRLATRASYLSSDQDTVSTTFFRLHQIAARSFKKGWVGGKVNIENNQLARKNEALNSLGNLSPISQRYEEFEAFTGYGDSTQVFVQARYQYRKTDSVLNGALTRFNSAHNIALQTTPIKNKNTQVALFTNYRRLQNEFQEDEENLNVRLQYSQSLFDNGIRFTTALETNNGVIPQQEFTYVEVEPGQGFFTWNDYNNNGIQELEEFEIAQFQDEASFIRILLPNQTFIRINENAFSQTLILDPKAWASKKSPLKLLSKFYNQTTYSIDRKIRNEGGLFLFNPFTNEDGNVLGGILNFRNIVYYNRGKQRYTTTYTYLNTATSSLLAFGLQENTIKSHQLQFIHKAKDTWLFNFTGMLGSNENSSENFSGRNFLLENFSLQPRVSYLLSPQSRIDVFFEQGQSENLLGDQEFLTQQKIGASFTTAKSEKLSLNGEFTYINNNFTGSAFSPVAFQMLEGLLPGTNFTWRLAAQKRITKYLDLTFSYLGRDSEGSRTIHTGNMQLRAFF